MPSVYVCCECGKQTVRKMDTCPHCNLYVCQSCKSTSRGTHLYANLVNQPLPDYAVRFVERQHTPEQLEDKIQQTRLVLSWWQSELKSCQETVDSLKLLLEQLEKKRDKLNE